MYSHSTDIDNACSRLLIQIISYHHIDKGHLNKMKKLYRNSINHTEFKRMFSLIIEYAVMYDNQGKIVRYLINRGIKISANDYISLEYDVPLRNVKNLRYVYRKLFKVPVPLVNKFKIKVV
jgi:hypothetical protein